MKQHLLRRILWLAVCLLPGCGGGKNGPPPLSQPTQPPPPAPGATPSPNFTIIDAFPRGGGGPEAGDALEFSEGGMIGHTVVRWDPTAGRLLYESTNRMQGPAERWERQPSRDEWAGFWAAMDAAHVWEWKRDYGIEMAHTDCVGWRVSLRHGDRSMSSEGCSRGPEKEAFRQVTEALTRLRGDASAASDQALLEVKHLQQSADWEDRIRTVRRLKGMGALAAGAVPALVDLLGAAPPPQHRAAPGREPIDVARAVQPLMTMADNLLDRGVWDQAIPLYDRVLARDPQNELAAGRRARAIEMRDARGPRSAKAGRGPGPSFVAAYETARNQAAFTAAVEETLEAIGEPAVPALIEALQDKNPHRAGRAAGVLGRLPAAASMSAPALAGALRDPAVRNAAARALMRIAPQDNERYLPVLISGLHDPDADVARMSAAALAQLGTPAVLPALMHALHDNRTRGIAMTGLGRMGPLAVAAVPELLDSLLLTREASERSTAERALKTMGAATVVPVIVDVLRNDKEGWKRNEAVLALARLGPAAGEAVPALIDTFRYGNTLSANAAEAVVQIGAPAVPALTAALKCDQLAPAPAAPLSGPWKPQSQYPETEYVRMNAAYVLGRVGAPAKAAIPALREALSDASPTVRDAATRALHTLERP